MIHWNQHFLSSTDQYHDHRRQERMSICIDILEIFLSDLNKDLKFSFCLWFSPSSLLSSWDSASPRWPWRSRWPPCCLFWDSRSTRPTGWPTTEPSSSPWWLARLLFESTVRIALTSYPPAVDPCSAISSSADGDLSLVGSSGWVSSVKAVVLRSVFSRPTSPLPRPWAPWPSHHSFTPDSINFRVTPLEPMI